ncbi:MAG: amidohydrolase [Proteobacteria bacterium]|nr:amidohydrolase [Pseudomonadota bacterium]MDA0993960.1 amidohydrolase [Pseudomonadota bacterium]
MTCTFVLLATPIANAGETLLHSVTGYTSTNSGVIEFSTLVIDSDGRVVATGGDELIAEYDDAIAIDGKGRFVLPGLHDSHGHVSSQGFLNVELNVTGSESQGEAVAKIAAYDKANPGSGWIKGRGWNQVLWPVREFPTAAAIDVVVSDRPVWLRRIDGHAGWANSKALVIAGIDNDTADPVGGKIIRDDNGVATGTLIDAAMDFVSSQVPPSSKDDYRRAFMAAFKELTSLGLTSVHDAGIDISEAEVYMSMADNGEIPMRIYAMMWEAGENLDAIGKPIIGYANDRLDIRSVKLMSDGALGSRGAAMIDPYEDDTENRGLRMYTQDDVNAKVKKANDLGFQVGIHAIGDFGNRQSLDAFEYSQGRMPSPLRNRVEHAQIIALDDIPRFAELGVIASMQATHATSDMNMAEDRIGSERLKGAYAWRKLLESGAVIANGSDFPVEFANPMHGMYASIARKSRAGLPDGGWHIEEGLTREETLHSFTLAAAYAALQEDRLGSLEPGKWADFIVVDRDFFKIPDAEIDDIQVLQTWVGGKLVYERCEDPDSADCEN